MNGMEEKSLRFVLKNYKQGAFDTQKALRAWKSRHETPRRRWRIGYYCSGMAASLLLCLGIYLYREMREEQAWQHIATAGEVVEHWLPDSTLVTLSPHSALRYRPDAFLKGERTVGMSGKAYFRVRRDAAHPFNVAGSHTTIRVLGTTFQVDETPADSATEVYVESGRVLFAAKEASEGIVLTQAMQARLLPGEERPRIVAPPTPNPAAWAVGTFVYEETPLAVVLKELSDYYHVGLTTTATGKTLTAEFGTNDGLEVILPLIEASLGIKIEKE